MQQHITRILTLGLALTTLTACGDVRQSLGLDPTPPDEFTIMKYEPLSIPPDSHLRPPVKAEPKKPVDSTVHKPPVNESLSPAQQDFLMKAGSVKADPNIKAEIEAETKISTDATLVDKLLGKKAKDTLSKDDVLDASAEADRLKDK